MARDYDIAINTRDDKNEIIDERIEMLNNWIEALEEIKSGRAETRVCAERNIDKAKLRHFIFCDANHYAHRQTTPEKELVLINGAERLYLAITGDKLLTNVPNDVEKVMEYCLKHSHLCHKDISVLRMRHWEGLTLEETGNKFNLTRERIRQVEARAFRKIKKYNHEILKYGMLGHDIKRQEALERSLSMKEAYLKRHRDIVLESNRINKEMNEIEPKITEKDEMDYDVCFMSFEEFAEYKNLSARLTNCIRRSRFRNHKMCDFEKVSYLELQGISYMGAKSLKEFVSALEEHNIKIGRLTD